MNMKVILRIITLFTGPGFSELNNLFGLDLGMGYKFEGSNLAWVLNLGLYSNSNDITTTYYSANPSDVCYFGCLTMDTYAVSLTDLRLGLRWYLVNPRIANAVYLEGGLATTSVNFTIDGDDAGTIKGAGAYAGIGLQNMGRRWGYNVNVTYAAETAQDSQDNAIVGSNLGGLDFKINLLWVF
jgi:hypothetical protein